MLRPLAPSRAQQRCRCRIKAPAFRFLLPMARWHHGVLSGTPPLEASSPVPRPPQPYRSAPQQEGIARHWPTWLILVPIPPLKRVLGFHNPVHRFPRIHVPKDLCFSPLHSLDHLQARLHRQLVPLGGRPAPNCPLRSRTSWGRHPRKMDKRTLVKPPLQKRLSAGMKRRQGGRHVLRLNRRPNRERRHDLLKSSERQSNGPLSGKDASRRSASMRQSSRKLVIRRI